MKRLALQRLVDWKTKVDRKPLIVRGARQVGKTWLLRKFGKLYYKDTVYINFENNPSLKNIFTTDFDCERIIRGIEIATDQNIDAAHSLIVFDEVQEAPEAITSLKYFRENAPEYNIVCAGSLLGVAHHNNVSFPVGKVNFLNLHPLSFREFLLALGETKWVELLKELDWDLISSFSIQLKQLLRLYYFVGGMPEAVAAYRKYQDLNQVREIQHEILTTYEQDFSKHADPSEVTRIRMVWNSIPAQLSRENKKFVYGIIRKGARAKSYEAALTWLEDSGLIYRVHQVNKPEMPLKAYEEFNAFKIFMVDVGLLGAMTSLDKKLVLEKNAVFKQFKWALTEQFVLQELKSLDALPIYYWSAHKGNAEVDFVIQAATEVVPLEVKAEENLKAKSLGVYAKKFEPKWVLRSSMANYRKERWMQNIPLFALSFFVADFTSP